MAAPGWIELFTTPLEALEIRYMVTGSVASMVYGEPRMTLDVDRDFLGREIRERGLEGVWATLSAHR